jgi:hypothetical protein
MERIIEEVYLTSRKDSREARRWSMILLAALAYLCTLSFGYVRISHEQRQAQDELDRLSARTTEVRSLVDSLSGLQTIRRSFTNELQNSLAEVRRKFGDLEAMVDAVVNPSFTDGDHPDSEPVQTPTPIFVQMQRPTSRATRRPSSTDLAPFTEEQKMAIGASQSGGRQMDTDRLRSALSDYVRSAILDPWFVRVNDVWQRHVQRIDAASDSLIGRLQELECALAATKRGSAAIDVNLIDPIVTEVRNARKNAAALKFSSPQDETWWYTTAEKAVLVSKMAETAEASIEGFVTGHASLGRLKEDLEKAHAAHARLVTNLQGQQERKRAEITNLTEQIGRRVKPLEFIALDPDLVGKGLPLLLGIVIGAVLYWNARCEHRLAAARRLLSAGWEGQTGRDRSQRLAGCDMDRLPWLLLSIGSIGWVVVSGLVLAYFRAVTPRFAILMTLLGSVIVIASTRRRRVI